MNTNLISLHIGGTQPHSDWKILDIEVRPGVDFVSNASDLTWLPDESVAVIYASHVLEHFRYNLNDELLNTLIEWRRVLIPGGKLLISVPDLKTLCWLYLNPNLTPDERHYVMQMIFGGQVNEYDVHYVGFDFDTLGMYLHEAGFQGYHQVSEFSLFEDDCSSIRFCDTLISLNVVAIK